MFTSSRLVLHLRSTAVWLAVTAAAVAIAVTTAPAVLGWQDGGDFGRLLVSGAAAVALAAASWLWIITTTVVVGVLRSAGAPPRAAVGVCRTLVLAACGVAVLGTTAAATAAPPQSAAVAVSTDDADRPDRSHASRSHASAGADRTRAGDPHDLAGLPLPDRATGDAGAHDVRDRRDARRTDADRDPTRVGSRTTDAAPTGPAGTVTVQHGDSLWSIAADQVGPEADASLVAAYWRRLQATNAAVVGNDPDLIHPGQVLDLPSR